MQLFTSNFFK